MILGTGIDIIEIKRIERVVNKRDKFLDRFFTLGEKKYFRIDGKVKMESVAGYFAAKEAVTKSIGTGFTGILWKDVEIQKSSLGQPQVILKGKARVEAEKLGVKNILLSISHCKEYAVAQAIAIGRDTINQE